MENQKRGRGRPKVFTDEELKQHKTAYMLNSDWFCHICNTGRNYKLTGKYNHLKSKIHNKNLLISNLKVQINELTQKISND